jgi:hypothetical protein
MLRLLGNYRKGFENVQEQTGSLKKTEVGVGEQGDLERESVTRRSSDVKGFTETKRITISKDIPISTPSSKRCH